MESTIIEKIRQLPPELQEEVIHFIDFLRTKKKFKTEEKTELGVDWRLKSVS